MVANVTAKGEDQDWSWKTGSPEKAARMEAFIEWCLTPQPYREPDSKAKFAETIGVTVNTLRNYQRDPRFQKEMKNRSIRYARVDRLQDILDSLFVTSQMVGQASSVTAARTLLEFMGKATEEEEGVNVEDMTSEELVKLAMEVLTRAESSS